MPFPKGYSQKKFRLDPFRRRDHVYYPETDEVFSVDHEAWEMIANAFPYEDAPVAAAPSVKKAAAAAAAILENDESAEEPEQDGSGVSVPDLTELRTMAEQLGLTPPDGADEETLQKLIEAAINGAEATSTSEN